MSEKLTKGNLSEGDLPKGNLPKDDFPSISLAPVTGYTDHPFRTILRELGFQGLVYSEMVNYRSIIHNPLKVEKKLFFDSKERPIAIQVAGNDAEMMTKAALYVEENYQPNFININMGCPSKRTTRSSGGAALLKDTDRLRRILQSLVKALKTSISVKTRLGWSSEEEIFDLVKIFNEFDLNAVIVHMRTRTEMFRGPVHWELYKKIRNRLKHSFVVNGDITSVQDIIEIIGKYNPQGIMIGRGFINDPWLFRQLKQYMEKGNYRKIPNSERIEVFIRHLELNVKHYGEHNGVKMLRKFVRKYFSGFENCSKLTSMIMQLKSQEDIVECIKNFNTTHY